MKRIIAVLISVIIICACVPTAFAETGLSKTDSFKQAVKDYAKQYNEIYYTTTVLSENQDYVLFHLGDAVKAEKVLVIGDYEFHSETWINNNGNIGYCYYDGTVVYGIKEAVENKLITAERLSELIPNTEKRDEDYCLRRLMSNGYYAEKASIMGYVGDDIICYAFDADSGYSGVFNIGDYEFTSMNDYEDTSVNIFVIRKDYHGYFALPLKKAYDIMLIEDLEPYIEVLRKAQSEHNEGYYPFAFRKLSDSIEEKRMNTIKNSGFDVSFIRVLGKVGSYDLCYSGNGQTEWYHDEYNEPYTVVDSFDIGAYHFSYVDRMLPYRLELFVTDDNAAYTLEDAYDMHVIGDNEMDEIFPMIQYLKPYSFLKVEKKSDSGLTDAEKRVADYMHIELKEKSSDLKVMGELPGDKTVINFINMFVTDKQPDCIKLGDYIISYYIYANDKCPIFVVTEDAVYPIKDAYEKKVIDDSEMSQIRNMYYSIKGKGIDFFIEAKGNERTLNNYLEQKGWFRSFAYGYTELGEINGYTLARSFTTRNINRLELNEYIMTVDDEMFFPYNPAFGTELFLIKGEDVLTLEEAVKSGTVSVEDVKKLCEDNKLTEITFEKVEPQYQETLPADGNEATDPTAETAPKLISVPKALNRRTNPVTVKTSKKTVSKKKLKSKKQTLKAFTIKNAKGKVSVKVVKKGTSSKLYSKLKVKNNGTLTVKKGVYKKKTYRIKLRITAAGNSKFKPKTIYKTIKLRIK